MTVFNGFNSSSKILQYTDKLNNFLNCDKTLIVTELDLTNKCNNKCPACTGIKENGEELTWEEIQMIARDLHALGNQGVIISGGGEPLMHKDFIKTLELLKNYGMQIGLNSNGLALTEDKAEAIAKYCTYFRISLDAGSAEMYKKTHGMEPLAYEKVVSNIKLMADVKKRTGSEVSFTTGFLTSSMTASDMEAFIKVSKENGAGAGQFRPFTGDDFDISAEYKRLKEKYEDENFKVLASLQKYERFEEGMGHAYTKCRGMFFSTVITANCRMYACLHHRQDPNYLIGDMRGEGKSLREVWNSYRKWMVYENINPELCPPFCRNDSFNIVLDGLATDINHKEFL